MIGRNQHFEIKYAIQSYFMEHPFCEVKQFWGAKTTMKKVQCLKEFTSRRVKMTLGSTLANYADGLHSL